MRRRLHFALRPRRGKIIHPFHFRRRLRVPISPKSGKNLRLSLFSQPFSTRISLSLVCSTSSHNVINKSFLQRVIHSFHRLIPRFAHLIFSLFSAFFSVYPRYKQEMPSPSSVHNEFDITSFYSSRFDHFSRSVSIMPPFCRISFRSVKMKSRRP